MRNLKTQKLSCPPRRSGFTLMEVLLVLAILAVIIGLVLPNLIGSQQEAMKGATKVAIDSVEQALKLYAVHHDGEFPSGAQGLQALTTSPGASDPKWKGPYLEKSKAPADAWGNPLQYQYPSQHGLTGPDIWSNGPDKQPNTADDISNWTTS